MKIIAGVEKSFQGDVHFSDGYNIGYLEQEPKLDDSKTVIDIVKQGMQESVDVLQEYNDINNKFALPEYYEDADKMESLMKRQGELQDKIDALGAWDLDTKLNIVDAFSNLVTYDSYNISRFFSPDFNELIIKTLKSESFDIVLLESLFTTPYIETLKTYSTAKIILRSHNLEYIIWKRLL